MPPDATIEALAFWSQVSGLIWIAAAAYRWRAKGIEPGSAIFLLAAGAGWVGVLRLGTNLFGAELVPLQPGSVPADAATLVAAVLMVLVGALAGVYLTRRPVAELGLALLLMTGGPLLIIPLMTRDRLPIQTTDQYAGTPITDPSRPGMVLVPAGPFVMGTLAKTQLESIVGNMDGDEQPVRGVFLDSFYLDRTEVTNAAFARFVEATGHVTTAEVRGYGAVWGNDSIWFNQDGAQWRHPVGPDSDIDGLDDHPVVQVSWLDAVAFCTWSGKRLATEAEWEKAARGTDGRAYPWGLDFDPAKGNYCDSSCTIPHRDPEHSDGFVRTAPVGSFPAGASPYGAMDMAGNAWEWVADWYDPNYYRYAPDIDPQGPGRGRNGAPRASKVVRGGSFAATRDFLTTTSRSFDPYLDSYFGVGFRCAADG